MRNRLLGIALALLLATGVASAQLGSPPFTFTAGTIISPDEVNTIVNAVYANALNRTGGTMTGTLTTRAIVADGNNTRDLGASGTRWAAFYSVLGNFSGALTAGSTVDIAGDVNIGSGNVTIAAATGNTVVAGSFNASGAIATNTDLFVGSTANIFGAGINALDVAGGINAGSGNVGIVSATGQIPAISSTYFASLSGTNLTGVAMLGTANAFTARNDLLTYTETRTAPTISANALTLDLSTATHFDVALTANITTLTISNAPTTGKAGSFTLVFTADGTLRTVTWPASVAWAGAAAPTMTSTNGKKDFFTCLTYNAGTNWYCFTAGQNF
jgi:hypothetical protein